MNLGHAAHAIGILHLAAFGMGNHHFTVRQQAPQVRLWLVESGATAGRALLGKSDFEKGIAKSLDFTLSYDAKSAGAAANSGQPLPIAVPRSPIVREFRKLAEVLAGPALPVAKRKLFALSW